MTSRAIKLTARNCPFLRAQKALWNRPTYARLSAAVNAGGEDAGRAYLATLVRPGADVDAMAARVTSFVERERHEANGYGPCGCRDCMEIAIGEPGAMCHACEDAGCEGERECLAASAYGGEPEECEDDACTGCAWCDAQICITSGEHMADRDGTGFCTACGYRDPGPPEPRRSPSPCDPGCPGWAVFDAPHAASIQRCDECWADVPGAPDDTYYAAHPVCMAALELARAPQPDPPTPIHAACQRQGFCLLTADSTQPGVIVARLLGALITLAPGLHPESITASVSAALVPAALADALHPAWETPAAQAALSVLVELLNAHAPAGFVVLPEAEWYRLGFFQC